MHYYSSLAYIHHHYGMKDYKIWDVSVLVMFLSRLSTVIYHSVTKGERVRKKTHTSPSERFQRKTVLAASLYLTSRTQESITVAWSSDIFLSQQRKTRLQPRVVPVLSPNTPALSKLPVLVFSAVIMSFHVHGNRSKCGVFLSMCCMAQTDVNRDINFIASYGHLTM